jgi:hypothetical protein
MTTNKAHIIGAPSHGIKGWIPPSLIGVLFEMVK